MNFRKGTDPNHSWAEAKKREKAKCWNCHVVALEAHSFCLSVKSLWRWWCLQVLNHSIVVRFFPPWNYAVTDSLEMANRLQSRNLAGSDWSRSQRCYRPSYAAAMQINQFIFDVRTTGLLSALHAQRWLSDIFRPRVLFERTFFGSVWWHCQPFASFLHIVSVSCLHLQY